MHFVGSILHTCICGWALPQAPLGKLTALPRSPSLLGETEGEGRKKGKEREGKGKEGNRSILVLIFPHFEL